MRHLGKLIFAFYLIAGKTYGQVTITASAIPDTGTVFIFSHVSDTALTRNFGFGKTGTNNIWDFSSYTHNYSDTIKYYRPSNTAHFNHFPTAKLARAFGYGSNLFQYYYFDASGLYTVGFYSYPPYPQIFSQPVPYSFTPQEKLMPFPYQLNAATQQNSQVCSPPMPRGGGIDSIYHISSFTFSRKVLASGRIVLAGDTLPAILEYYLADFVDSTMRKDSSTNWTWQFDYSAGGGGGEAFYWYVNNSTQPYAWYYPVSDRIEFFETNQITEGIKAATYHSNHFSIVPNPANNKVRINHDRQERAQIKITNSCGQLLFYQDTDDDLDISSFPDGLYFITLIDESGSRSTQKLIKK